MHSQTTMNLPGSRRRETALLVDYLKAGQPGDTLTDAQLEQICGVGTAPGQPGYNFLRSAIKAVLREHGLVWERRNRGHCIECKTPTGVIASARADVDRLHRASKRPIRKLETLNGQQLSDEDRAALITTSAQAKGTAVMTSVKFRKKLDDRRLAHDPEVHRLLEAWLETKK